jgi:Xaa-Pro aminopeptidase
MDALNILMEGLPQQFDGALVTGGPNRRYLTGFVSSAGTIFITRDTSYFIADSRYFEAAQKHVRNCTVILEQGLTGQLREFMAKHRVHTIGVEVSNLSMARAEELREMVNPVQILSDHAFDDMLREMRQLKSPQEIEWMRQAQHITDEAFLHVLNYAKPGISELELMIIMGEKMTRLGCEKRSLNMLLSSGTNTSLPHGGAPPRNIEKGDLVMIDTGSMVQGYLSDMTRTFAVGEPGEEKRAVYDTVLRAQSVALGVIRTGIPCNLVDEAAKKVIMASPYAAGCYGHGLGHSLGLEIHEKPQFRPEYTCITQANMVMTVEPGIYFPGRFGVRIEDMVVITPEGYENQTESSNELIVL